MRQIIPLLLAVCLTGCGLGSSDPNVRSLVQDHWRRHGNGVPMRDLPYVCTARSHSASGRVTGTNGMSRECSDAVMCIAPIVENLPANVTWEYRGTPIAIRNGNDPELIAETYYPVFEPTIVRIVETENNVSDGLAPTATAVGSAKIEVRLTLSQHAQAVRDCPGMAGLLQAVEQPIIMMASLTGRQVNRGGGIRIEWSVDNVVARDGDQLAPQAAAETPQALGGDRMCVLDSASSDVTDAAAEITLRLSGNLCVNDRTQYARTSDDGFRRLVVVPEISALDVLTIGPDGRSFQRERYTLSPSQLEQAEAEVLAADLPRGCASADGDGGALSQRNDRLSPLATGDPLRVTYACQRPS